MWWIFPTIILVSICLVYITSVLTADLLGRIWGDRRLGWPCVVKQVARVTDALPYAVRISLRARQYSISKRFFS